MIAPKAYKLSWNVPVARTDGSSLAVSDVGGYDLTYLGRKSGISGVVHITGATTTSYSLNNLTPDTYDVVIFAYDSAGVASPSSNVVTIVAP